MDEKQRKTELFGSRNNASDTLGHDRILDSQWCARCTCLCLPTGGRFCFSVWVLCDCQDEAEGGLEASAQATCLVLGETLWSHPSSFGGNASILSSLLRLPDVDADGAPDLLLLTQEGKEVPLPPPAGSPRPAPHQASSLPLVRSHFLAELGSHHRSGASLRALCSWHLPTGRPGRLCPCWAASGPSQERQSHLDQCSLGGGAL